MGKIIHKQSSDLYYHIRKNLSGAVGRDIVGGTQCVWKYIVCVYSEALMNNNYCNK